MNILTQNIHIHIIEIHIPYIYGMISKRDLIWQMLVQVELIHK